MLDWLLIPYVIVSYLYVPCTTCCYKFNYNKNLLRLGRATSGAGRLLGTVVVDHRPDGYQMNVNVLVNVLILVSSFV